MVCANYGRVQSEVYIPAACRAREIRELLRKQKEEEQAENAEYSTEKKEVVVPNCFCLCCYKWCGSSSYPPPLIIRGILLRPPRFFRSIVVKECVLVMCCSCCPTIGEENLWHKFRYWNLVISSHLAFDLTMIVIIIMSSVELVRT